MTQKAYREGADSTFSSDGVHYQLDKIFEMIERGEVKMKGVPLQDLVWQMPAEGTLDPERVAKTDTTIPMITAPYPQGKRGENIQVVDGAHRLTKLWKVYHTQPNRVVMVYALTTSQLQSARVR